ncbi:dipeptide epimerase [Kallotenue papyrolyticum]|uniref:dipeptide epimerase n=1 Tax=Kallotenue papyrolyticum TaxID=1325125 RepID=UPI00047866C8|nr:dipeptide epimerase [Kallotenue papyrolyticum]
MTALTYQTLELRLRHTFRIAHGASDTRQNVILRLGDGLGEAAPVAYHGESAAGVIAALERWRPELERLDDPAAIVWLMQRLEGSRAAHAAVDIALHDWLGKRLNTPLNRLLGLAALPLPPTSFTIAIAEGADLIARVREAAAYPILKVKLGTPRDLELVETVRAAAPAATIRVDANAAWSAPQALAIVPRLAELGVELVEQPLPSDDHDGWQRLRAACLPVPIVADESIKSAADVARWAPVVDGVNIKLMKSGGISGALAAIHTARAHGLRVMLGCMVETSLGVTAAAHLGGLADWLDLDGPLLIADDPFVGVSYAGARLELPTGTGLGVSPRAPH